MSLLVALLGLLIGTLGAVGMVQPERLISFARAWQTPTGLCVAAALRIVLGRSSWLRPTRGHPGTWQ